MAQGTAPAPIHHPQHGTRRGTIRKKRCKFSDSRGCPAPHSVARRSREAGISKRWSSPAKPWPIARGMRRWTEYSPVCAPKSALPCCRTCGRQTRRLENHFRFPIRIGLKRPEALDGAKQPDRFCSAGLRVRGVEELPSSSLPWMSVRVSGVPQVVIGGPASGALGGESPGRFQFRPGVSNQSPGAVTRACWPSTTATKTGSSKPRDPLFLVIGHPPLLRHNYGIG